jgi:uncharacterized protein YbaA (DUF1428 family)
MRMNYVDGFVLAVPEKNLPDYWRLARAAGKIWREHGALDYKECVGDDLQVAMGVPFPKRMKTRPDEIVVFAHIVFKSRAHRDRVNAKVMRDPRLAAACDPARPPFAMNRMSYGGFQVRVDV